MLEDFALIFILILAAASIFRDDAIFTLLYLMAGVFLAGRWWSRRGLETLHSQRSFPQRVFLGEDIPVKIEVQQRGWLPLVWLRLQDHLPPGLGWNGTSRQVVSLAPRGHASLHYQIYASRRGYYRLGPLRMSSGDPFGISGDFSREDNVQALIIYPRVILLSSFKLPSHSPMGALKHHLPIYEDPTRVLSKRDYVAGDSLRRIDWKSSAAVGRLQVKQYEPSISLETMLLLNLNALEYDVHARYDAPELGIVVAASIANWVVSRQQAIGLCTNGLDPLGAEGTFDEMPAAVMAADNMTVIRAAAGAAVEPVLARPLSLGKGQQHLMRLLETLARIETATESKHLLTFLELVHQQRAHLPWGATFVLITGSVDDALFNEIFQARRAGLIPVLILVGNVPGVQATRNKAEFFNISFHHVLNELALDQWRTAAHGFRQPNLSSQPGLGRTQ